MFCFYFYFCLRHQSKIWIYQKWSYHIYAGKCGLFVVFHRITTINICKISCTPFFSKQDRLNLVFDVILTLSLNTHEERKKKKYSQVSDHGRKLPLKKVMNHPLTSYIKKGVCEWRITNWNLIFQRLWTRRPIFQYAVGVVKHKYFWVLSAVSKYTHSLHQAEVASLKLLPKKGHDTHNDITAQIGKHRKIKNVSIAVRRAI